MIRTGQYGFLLANWDRALSFPVVGHLPSGTRREREYASTQGMPPLGTYLVSPGSLNRAIYVRSFAWFDRNKKFLESWAVESHYAPLSVPFIFYMKVDGIA